jgi:hypothetical protein
VFDQRQAEELAKLDHLEKEYWEAWEHSKQERQRTRTRKASGQAPSESAELTKEKRDGNPKFLDGVLRCIDRRCALQGLNAPQRVQHGRDANATPISYEHRDSGIDPAAAAAFLADLDRLGRGVPSNGHAESLDPAHPAS